MTNPELTELISKANDFDSKGLKAEAIEHYQKALKIEPKSQLALANLATCFYENSDYDNSYKISRKLLKIDPENTTALINIGNCLYQKKDYERAAFFYKKADTLEEDYSVSKINLANAYFELRDYDNFIIKAVEALKLDSNRPWLHNQLSQVFQEKGDLKKSIEHGWQAIKSSQGKDSHHLNFAYLLYEISMEKGIDFVKDYVKKWQQEYGENQIAFHAVNALLGKTVSRANDTYVREVFDVFSTSFDEILKSLDYCVPKIISVMLPKDLNNLHILDAGCGTGLCGDFLKKHAAENCLYGVDISPKMIEVAATKKLYDHLFCEELTAFLNKQTQQYNLIVSADVLTYFGDLEELISGFAKVLRPMGRIFFSISENNINDQPYFLTPSARFVHKLEYVENLLKKTGFFISERKHKRLRNEGDNKVFGFVISAIKNPS